MASGWGESSMGILGANIYKTAIGDGIKIIYGATGDHGARGDYVSDG